jgi:N utilization substance protein B
MTNKPHPKRLARAAAVQAMYQWQLNETPAAELVEDAVAMAEPKTDTEYVSVLLSGVLESITDIDALLNEYGSRPLSRLTPIELAILRVATYELKDQLGVPYKVAVNEAVELAKQFGSPDGYKYVNAVLNAMLDKLRPHERGAKSE